MNPFLSATNHPSKYHHETLSRLCHWIGSSSFISQCWCPSVSTSQGTAMRNKAKQGFYLFVTSTDCDHTQSLISAHPSSIDVSSRIFTPYSAKLSKHPQATPLTLESLQAQAQMLQAKYGSGRQSSFSVPKQNTHSNDEHEFSILPVGEESSEYRQEMNKGHGVPLTGECVAVGRRTWKGRSGLSFQGDVWIEERSQDRCSICHRSRSKKNLISYWKSG